MPRKDPFESNEQRGKQGPKECVEPPPPPAPPQECLGKMLLFNHLDDDMQNQIVGDMYERRIGAGEILIREGDTGVARCLWVCLASCWLTG